MVILTYRALPQLKLTILQPVMKMKSARPAIQYHFSFLLYIPFAAMGISKPKKILVVDGAVLGTGSSTISTIGIDHVLAVVAASALPAKRSYASNGVGSIVASTIGCMNFHFYSGGA